MVGSAVEGGKGGPERERITRAARKKSMPIEVVTKTQSIRHTSEKNSRTPSAKTTIPVNKPAIRGQPKLSFKLSVEAFRQPSTGPTRETNRTSSPIGKYTYLKNNAPTQI